MATLFAGSTVVGLRVGGDQVEVHMVADGTLTEVAERVAAAAQWVLAAADDPRLVRVVVDDVVVDAIGSPMR